MLNGSVIGAKGHPMTIESVALIGKGAIGLLHGTAIARSFGSDAVEFVMDDGRFARHAGETLTVNGEPCTIPTIPASQAKPVDLVILTVKATGLEQALDTMEPLVGPQTRIMSLLNGIRSEELIARRFGWERTVLSITQGMDAVFLNGALTYEHPGEIRFGAAAGTDPGVVEDIARLLERTGIAYAIEPDARRRQWVKLMLNVGINQTCMVYQGTYGSACKPGSEQNRCFVAAMREALAVGRAEGVELSEEDLTQMARLVASLDPAGMPSMAQDRINRKPTEVEEFAGTIVGLAEKHGMLVPQNAWLYRQIRAIERSYGA